MDPLFRLPLPVYQPWWWSLDTFQDDVREVHPGDHNLPRPVLPIRTLVYVGLASPIRLVLGYAVAYDTARYAGRWKWSILVLLISLFWVYGT